MYYKHTLLTALLLTSTLGYADKDKKKDKGKDASAPTAEKKSEKKTIKEAIKGTKEIKGLFTIYQDTTTGNTLLKVSKEQIGKAYIYFSYCENGSIATGQIKGGFRGSSIFNIKKYFNRIELVSENTNYYHNPNNPISKVANANVGDAILVSQTILGEDSSGYVIKADDIFLTEYLQAIKGSGRPNDFFNLGQLSKDKSKYVSIKNYPQNTDVVVEYTYDNNTGNAQPTDLADSRFATIRIQHSLIEVPKDNGFTPRADDPRIGFFMEQVNDLTATKSANYKDVIHRWNLVKKDPNATLSEPVKPITYWIENTTPLEFRETIKTAGLAWNKAFEKAGFKNAIRIEIQSDTATWDAGDIRYNVLRWVASPNPAYGGYGPSFVNPRTGEILGADIMLEYIFVTNRLRQEVLYGQSANYINPTTSLNANYCDAGMYLQQQQMLGTTALNVAGATEVEVKAYIQQSLYYLVLHEMGHTLGLNHNMRASQLYSPAELNNVAVTEKTGLTGSVMDYPAVNIAADKAKQGQYFTTTPGPYDLWAMEYGYSTGLSNEEAEAKRLADILARSGQKELAFGNDADDMRSPGNGIDPRVNINDMSSDAITFATDRIKIVNSLIPKLKDKFLKNGESYHELVTNWNILLGDMGNNATCISRYVGGVYVNRAYTGTTNSTQPYTPVPADEQKRALVSLNANLFAPNAFEASNGLYAYLQLQRRGFGFFGNNEDPRLHERALNMQKAILAHLLNANVLERMTDASLYGNNYSDLAMMTDLTKGIFDADLAGKVNTIRQNLQVEYTKRLLDIAVNEKGTYDYVAQSAALAQVKSIKTKMATPALDAETKAHREHIAFDIAKALDKK